MTPDGWQLETVTAQGDSGMYPVLRMDAEDNPHIVHGDRSTAKIMYTYKDGNQLPTDSWADFDSDDLFICSFCLDAQGYPHLCYKDLETTLLAHTYQDASGQQHLEGPPCQSGLGSLALSDSVLTGAMCRMGDAESCDCCRIDIPGAVVRQAIGFGDASKYSGFAGEYFSLKAGTDITPLLKGLKEDLCQSPHWGYMLEGEVTLTYSDGHEETTSEGELFYWPEGHTVRIGQDAEIILFSPQYEHCNIVDHLRVQLMK